MGYENAEAVLAKNRIESFPLPSIMSTAEAISVLRRDAPKALKILSKDAKSHPYLYARICGNPKILVGHPPVEKWKYVKLGFYVDQQAGSKRWSGDLNLARLCKEASRFFKSLDIDLVATHPYLVGTRLLVLKYRDKSFKKQVAYMADMDFRLTGHAGLSTFLVYAWDQGHAARPVTGGIKS